MSGVTAPLAAAFGIHLHARQMRGARLTDEFMSYSVVVRQPDGSLKEFCFVSREAAEAALKSPFVAPQTLPTE